MVNEMTNFNEGMANEAAKVRAGRAKGPLGAEAANAHKVAQEMLADGEALLDRTCLLAHIRSFGMPRSNWRGFAHLQDWQNSSRVGLLQQPTEFADFLLYCARYRPATMIEIGAFTGGTSFIAAAFFKALNPDFKMTVIDLGDYILLERRTLDLLGITIDVSKTSPDLYGQPYDIVFIDGDHSYFWAKSDFFHLGKFAAKVCGMHDINGREYREKGGGVFAFWRQLRQSLCQQVPMLEICHAGPEIGLDRDGDWMGIGVVDFGQLTSDQRKAITRDR